MISLGRSTDNDIVIDEQSVSRRHLLISYDNDSELLIHDQKSSNGTFINTKRIAKSILTSRDTLKLGTFQMDVGQLIKEVKKITIQKKTDFSEEFSSVLKSFEHYQDAKNKLANDPKKQIFIRLGIIGVALVLCFIYVLIAGIEMKSFGWYYVVIGATMITTLIVPLFKKSNADKSIELDKLRLAYEDQLVCPKCQRSLMDRGIGYWQGRANCANPRCDALYIKPEK